MFECILTLNMGSS